MIRSLEQAIQLQPLFLSFLGLVRTNILCSIITSTIHLLVFTIVAVFYKKLTKKLLSFLLSEAGIDGDLAEGDMLLTEEQKELFFGTEAKEQWK